MKTNLCWMFGVCVAMCLGAACGGSSNSGSGGEAGGTGGDSSSAGGQGGSVSTENGGSAAGVGGSSSGGSASGGSASGGNASGGNASGGSGGSASGGSSGSGEIKIEDYPLAVATAECGQLVKCCGNTDPRCVPNRRSPIFAGLKDLKAAIAAGGVLYDSAKLSDCLSKLKALACDAKQADVDALHDCSYLKGTIANGAACTIGLACKDGFCEPTGVGTAKECIARRDLGAACSGGDECKTKNCKFPTTNDVEGKCAAADAPKPGLCGALTPI